MTKYRSRVFIICLLLFLLTAAQPALGSDWAKFQKDNYNTGVTEDRAPVTDPAASSLSWEYKLGGNVDSTPLVVGDMMYVAAGNNHVYAFKRTTGELVWEKSTSGSTGFLIGNAAVGNGIVFVPTSDGKIFAFDAETGNLKWSKEFNGKQIDTPVSYSDGKIYFGEAVGGHKYYCYDVNGNEVWSRTATSSISGEGSYYWSGAAVIGNSLVYGDDDGNLVCVNKNTGADIAEISVSEEFGVTSGGIRSSILYVEELERIYFTSTGGYCFALGFNSADGTFKTSDKHSAVIPISTSTPAYYNGRVYLGAGKMFAGGENGVFCLDSDLSSVIWKYPAGIVQSSPAISTYYDDGDGEVYIYFTVNDNKKGGVYCLKDFTGCTSPELSWSFVNSSMTSYSLQGVAISDGWIYFGSDKKYVFGLTTPYTPVPVAPVADFSASPLSGDAPLNVQFTDKSAGSPSSWSWDFENDGKVDSTEQNPVHTFAVAGNYNVNLTVSNNAGSNSIVKSKFITVSESSIPSEPEPVAAFTADVTSGTLPLTVSFTDQSTGSPTSWAWDFGDGSNSSEQNPSHIYSKEGNYAVSLTVSNENSSDSLEVAGMITVSVEIPSVSDDTWYQFHKDALHSGYMNSSAPNSANVAWIAQPLDDTYSLIPSSSVAIAEGKVFGLCNGPTDDNGNPESPYGQLVAFDERTGKEVWNVTVSAPEWGSWSSPAYDSGKVFASAGIETYCVNASTGDVIWTFHNPSDLASCNGGPAIGDGKVFASDWDGGNYYCLDENTGALLWTFTVDGTFAQATPAYKDGKVYFSCWASANAVYCVNAATGELIWKNDNFESNPCGSVTISNDGLYVTVFGSGSLGGIYKLDLTDGHILWSRSDVPPTDSTPAVLDGKVYFSAGYFATSDLKTYCLDAADGQTIWETNASDKIGDWACSPAIADGKVFTGGASEEFSDSCQILYALNADTGAVVWSYEGCGCSPAVADNTVFSTGSGKLYAFKESETLFPQANFSSNLSSGKAPLSVSFKDETVGEGISSWAWDFENDGIVDSTEQNPVHTFTVAGNYTVNLVVSNNAGSNSIVKVDFIIVSESSTPEETEPVAAFTADVTSGTLPLTVNFTDQSTGSPTSWLWDFGDGATASEQNVSHTYTAAGSYTVKLSVTNDSGSDEEIKSDYIKVVKSSGTQGNNSATVSLSVTIIPVVSIEVSPLALDFGELSAGKTSEAQNLIIKNTGGCDVNVTADVVDSCNGDELFSKGLLLDSQKWNNYWKVVGRNSQENTSVSLQVPSDYAGIGNKKGTITFWAEAA
ncbi:MAG: PKD domain-containing protein [Euryarchaeota archaeon]|nr:PKD domain-containing protein [Euryarchaeota archaeon]